LQAGGTLTENDVVEGADVEPLAEPRAGELSQAEDLELPDLVGKSLCRPGPIQRVRSPRSRMTG
jgi:hypothetical protein